MAEAKRAVSTDKLIYDKSYAQVRGDFTLSKVAFKVVTARIEGYRHYKRIVDHVENKSENLLKKEEIESKVTAKAYIRCIENGLNWIPEEYQDAIWKKVVSDEKWIWISYNYSVSETTLHRYWQIYVYGVAMELGEEL